MAVWRAREDPARAIAAALRALQIACGTARDQLSHAIPGVVAQVRNDGRSKQLHVNHVDLTHTAAVPPAEGGMCPPARYRVLELNHTAAVPPAEEGNYPRADALKSFASRVA